MNTVPELLVEKFIVAAFGVSCLEQASRWHNNRAGGPLGIGESDKNFEEKLFFCQNFGRKKDKK